MMWIGGAEMWGEVYLFSMCIRRDAVEADQVGKLG